MQSDLVIAKLFHDRILKQYGTWSGAFPAQTHLLSNGVNHVSRSPVFDSCKEGIKGIHYLKNSEYDQERSQSQTPDKPMAPQVKATQPSRDTRKTN